MPKIIVALLFTWPCIAKTVQGADAVAKEVPTGKKPYYFKIQHAHASETDFLNTLYFDYDKSPDSGPVTALSLGKTVSHTLFGYPIEIVAFASVQHLDENGFQPDAYGVSFYFKGSYTFSLPKNLLQMRVGFGEGLNYVSRIPTAESRDFAKKGAESNKLMNYLEYSLDIPLSQFGWKSSSSFFDEIYISYTTWHRSSIFGLMAEEGGGINYQGISIEFKF